jgi:hypothetical protein
MMGCLMNFRVVVHMGWMVSRWRSAEQRLTCQDTNNGLMGIGLQIVEDKQALNSSLGGIMWHAALPQAD